MRRCGRDELPGKNQFREFCHVVFLFYDLGIDMVIIFISQLIVSALM